MPAASTANQDAPPQVGQKGSGKSQKQKQKQKQKDSNQKTFRDQSKEAKEKGHGCVFNFCFLPNGQYQQISQDQVIDEDIYNVKDISEEFHKCVANLCLANAMKNLGILNKDIEQRLEAMELMFTQFDLHNVARLPNAQINLIHRKEDEEKVLSLCMFINWSTQNSAESNNLLG